MVYRTNGLSLDDALTRYKIEPGYQLLNWLSMEMDWGIFGVNVIGGAIFAVGLVVFCRRQPAPWLALAIAVPYVVIVVAMGYSRQGIALGLSMLGLVALGDGLVLRFVVLVVLAATFHKSAILLLPISALSTARNRYWTAAWVALTALGAYKLLLERDTEALYTNYVVANLQSEGALLRLSMNALPAAILLIWRSKFKLAKSEARLWILFAIISLALLGIYAIVPSSTALDRVALYFLPLQLIVFSHLPYVFSTRPGRSQTIVAVNAFDRNATMRSNDSNRSKNIRLSTAAVLLFYGLVQFVWFNFATNAFNWLPYRFYPLEFFS
jgi:hypothetical protein